MVLHGELMETACPIQTSFANFRVFADFEDDNLKKAEFHTKC